MRRTASRPMAKAPIANAPTATAPAAVATMATPRKLILFELVRSLIVFLLISRYSVALPILVRSDLHDVTYGPLETPACRRTTFEASLSSVTIRNLREGVSAAAAALPVRVLSGPMA